MFLTTHALASGLLAERINNPLVAYPLILATHFFMDSIPHLDFGCYIGDELKRKGEIKSLKKRVILGVLGAIDIGTAALFTWLLFGNGLLARPVVLGGVLVGLLPDLLEVPPLFLNWRPPFLKKLEDFHSYRIHRGAKFIPGIITQIIILFLVFRLR